MRKLLRMGLPTLLKPSEPITEFGTPWLRELADEMFCHVYGQRSWIGSTANRRGAPATALVRGTVRANAGEPVSLKQA